MASARFKKACLDANDPDRLGPFWAEVLGLRWQPYPHGEGGVFGAGPHPVIWLNRVPDLKVVKHRVHFDVYARHLADLEALGSTVVRAEGAGRHWTVLADPEGGEYCAFLPAELPADRLHALVVDSAEPAAQATWWAAVFGASAGHDRRGFSSVTGIPGMPIASLDFVPVPEPKTVKNRIHWDLAVADPQALVDAGATVLRAPGGDVSWHVLADPEGNEFCAFTDPTGG